MSAAVESALLFDCAGETLLGIAHIPQSATQSIGVVIVVGGPQYRVGSHRQFTLMARSLARRGFAVLRFDYRGMGDSTGAARGFDRVDDDIAAAIDALQRAAPAAKRIVLWGLCDAASACMIYGQRRDPRVVGLVAANPWVRTEAGEAAAYMRHYYLQRFFQKSFWAKIFSGSFNPFRSLRDLFATAKRARGSQPEAATGPGDYIEQMRQGFLAAEIPMLLLISGQDLTAQEFLALCARQRSWASVLGHRSVTREDFPSSDHTFATPGSLGAASDSSARWLEKLCVGSIRTAQRS